MPMPAGSVAHDFGDCQSTATGSLGALHLRFMVTWPDRTKGLGRSSVLLIHGGLCAIYDRIADCGDAIHPARAVIGTTLASSSRPSIAATSSRPHRSIARTCSGHRLAR